MPGSRCDNTGGRCESNERVNAIMMRQFRRFGGGILPEVIKRPLRGRLYGFVDSRVDLDVGVSKDGDTMLVSIGEAIKFRIREEDYDDFAFHFVHNGASVEEMHGFIEAARSARTLFDVGAHKGLFSLVFCASGAEKRAIAFEPSPVLNASLRELADLNGFGQRVTLRETAIGERSGIVTAAINADGFFSLRDDSSPDASVMQMASIDDECSRLGIQPDVLKIDIEGYEYEALKGARTLLSEKRPVVCLELHLDLLERRGVAPKAVCDELSSRGYEFFSCDGRRRAPREIYGSANAVLRFIAR
jgi:FkbM family methyltransferase